MSCCSTVHCIGSIVIVHSVKAALDGPSSGSVLPRCGWQRVMGGFFLPFTVFFSCCCHSPWGLAVYGATVCRCLLFQDRQARSVLRDFLRLQLLPDQNPC